MPRKSSKEELIEMAESMPIEESEPMTSSNLDRAASVFMGYLTPDIVTALEEISILNEVPIAQLILACVVRAYQQGSLTESIAREATGVPVEGSPVLPKAFHCKICGILCETKVLGQIYCPTCSIKEHERIARENFEANMKGIDPRFAGSGLSGGI